MYPNLKLQLFRTGMRQNRLAQCLGLDESILSKIVNGFREPSPDLRERIASLLQTDEKWLFQWIDPQLGVARLAEHQEAPAPAPLKASKSSEGV